MSESADSHGHDDIPKVRSCSIARGLPFGRGIPVIKQESHVLVFRAIQKIGQVGRIEPDTRRLAGIRGRKGFLTLSDRTILGANAHLVRGHLDDDTARFAFGELRDALERTTQVVAIQREGGRMTLWKDSLIAGESAAQFAAEQQTFLPYEEYVVVRNGAANRLIIASFRKNAERPPAPFAGSEPRPGLSARASQRVPSQAPVNRTKFAARKFAVPTSIGFHFIRLFF
jgi:hypothetical protein